MKNQNILDRECLLIFTILYYPWNKFCLENVDWHLGQIEVLIQISRKKQSTLHVLDIVIVINHIKAIIGKFKLVSQL